MTRNEVVGTISSVWMKFVQNTVRVVQHIHKEVVVHVSNQLRWRGIVHSVQAKPDSSSDR